MLSVNLLVLFASLLVCAHAATVSESDSDSDEEPTPRLFIGDGQVGGNIYFTDPEMVKRTWTDAQGYCESQGAELAKVVTPAIYRSLRVSVPSIGEYWIDGIDRETLDRFELDQKCTPSLNNFSLNDKVPVILPPTSCLTLSRARSIHFSRIQSMPCTSKNLVLCSIPLNGCEQDGSDEDPTVEEVSGEDPPAES